MHPNGVCPLFSEPRQAFATRGSTGPGHTEVGFYRGAIPDPRGCWCTAAFIVEGLLERRQRRVLFLREPASHFLPILQL